MLPYFQAAKPLLAVMLVASPSFAQDPTDCASNCAKMGASGCCEITPQQCLWFTGGFVTNGGVDGEAAANCHVSGCDGWNWRSKCTGTGVPITPAPSPPAPSPPTPSPPTPALPPNPTGNGTVVVNHFVNSAPWVARDGQRIQAHSGMVFDDTANEGGWVLIGNSDVVPTIGSGQNGQVSVYRAPELYGPWGPEQVLVTAAQLNTIPGMERFNFTIGIVERPKLCRRDGWYYLFLHIEPGGDAGYSGESLGMFRFQQLAPPSAQNSWTVVFAGHPGHNALTGQGFRVLDFGLFDDTVSGKLLYTATTDSYRFPGTCCTSDPPGTCNYTKKNLCANTALVTFVVDLNANPVTFDPVATLPGRWEAPSLFRDPRDSDLLYMMCSGQDGFGPNPVGLFSAHFGRDGATAGKQRAVSYSDSADWKWPAPEIWECMGLPHSGSGNAFNTQPFQVIPNPYSKDHGIYLGDNWLHGPGKVTTGDCANPGWHGMENCEPWQGNCPCNFPNNKCPGTSSPGFTAGYVWLPFSWTQLKSDPKYLICARNEWNLQAPPSDPTEPCYTFNVFPDTPYTPGLDPALITDYRSKHVPFVESSCGFIPCPGWPMTEADNTANTTLCCQRLGDALTQGRNAGRCRADDLCLGKCKETENNNIPGGHGGCTFAAFDPSKARLLDDTSDCTKVRTGTLDSAQASTLSSVVDPCRGTHIIPH